MELRITTIKNVLTRTTGYLKGVTSHSLQPYRGCTLGRSLCGVGCYVQHNRMLTKGAAWGGFLDVRENAADSYCEHHARESTWARRNRGGFRVFLSSSTDPFLPQESRYGVSSRVLEAMCELPPDGLVVQTHSHRVAGSLDVLRRLAGRTELRVHLSIETDRESFAGLPPHASSVSKRLVAARAIREAGIRTIITVAPLLPIDEPERFFARIADSADGVVLDHFIGGDGSPDGRRTRATALPAAMERVEAGATSIEYLQAMAAVASAHMPGRVAVGSEGFAGRGFT